MYYTANPVADAERYYDELEEQAYAKEAAESEFAEIIQDAFTVDLTTCSNTKILSVPYVASFEGKIKYQPISEAIGEEINEAAAFAILMEVLQKSPCALVDKLRKEMARHYADYWVSDLGDAA